MEPIILASSSPRRQEILKMLKIPYRVIMPNIDETISTMLSHDEIPELLAREKVLAVIRSLPVGQEIPWVLGADTIISFNGKLYGKPQDQDEAFEFLKDFQGNTHTILTALVLYNGKTRSTTSKLCKTEVTFSKLSDEEIQWYVDTGEWHGAAGGYRIQSLASMFISHIDDANTKFFFDSINQFVCIETVCSKVVSE